MKKWTYTETVNAHTAHAMSNVNEKTLSGENVPSVISPTGFWWNILKPGLELTTFRHFCQWATPNFGQSNSCSSLKFFLFISLSDHHFLRKKLKFCIWREKLEVFLLPPVQFEFLFAIRNQKWTTISDYWYFKLGSLVGRLSKWIVGLLAALHALRLRFGHIRKWNCEIHPRLLTK